MSRKVRRVPVVLDVGEIRDLPMEDIRVILRSADELISTGGRSMLAKILKGSKDKKILEYKLNECPAHNWPFTYTCDICAIASNLKNTLLFCQSFGASIHLL